MCSRNCCGVIWSTILLLTLAFCLAFPWYGIAFKYNGGISPSLTDDCERVILIGWRDMYCRSNCGDVMANNNGTLYTYGCGTDDSKDHANWRDICSSGHFSCDGAKRLFDVAGATAGLSLVCAFFSFVYFLARCCCVRRYGKNMCHTVVTLVGLIFLIAAVGYFADRAPKQFSKDEGLPYVAVEYGYGPNEPFTSWCPENGPCSKFFGETHQTTSGVQSAEIVWGGAGWIGAAVVFLFYIVVASISCCRDQREYEPMNSANGQSMYGPVDPYYNNSAYQSGQAPRYA